mgnify:FL=1
MIEYITGEIVELSPTTVILESYGIGYNINISLNTFTSLQGKKQGKLFIYEAIREDAYILFGFSTQAERELFLLLITVSGIGGNTARMVLSTLSPEEVISAIGSSNVSLLTSVKGVGKKTAERIIVDLRDKIDAIGLDGKKSMDLMGQSMDVEIQDEAVAALKMLGFSAHASQKVVHKILKENTGLTVEQVIKQALKKL